MKSVFAEVEFVVEEVSARPSAAPVTSRVEAPADSHRPLTNQRIAKDMHPTSLLMAGGVYVLMIATFWLAFVTKVPTAIAMGIVTVCLAAYLAVPFFMARIGKSFWTKHGWTAPRQGSFGEFLDGYVEVDHGVMPAKGALALVISLPICLAGAAIGMSIVFNVI